MSRLVTVSVTMEVGDDTEIDSLANVIYNVAEGGVDTWADVNGWDVLFLNSEITENIEAE